MQEQEERVEQEEREEINQLKQTIQDLNARVDEKISELSRSMGKKFEEKKEYAAGKVSENPLAYLAGAFFGGIIMGYVMSRSKS